MSKYILSFFVRISQLSYGCTVLSVSFCRFEQGNTPKKTNVRPVLPVILSGSKDALLHKLVNMLFFHIFHVLKDRGRALRIYVQCSAAAKWTLIIPKYTARSRLLPGSAHSGSPGGYFVRN